MRIKDDGGAAFPTIDANRAEDYGSYGMTLRDYFASKALANASWIGQPKTVAEWAYQVADAMIEERNK